MFTRKISTDEYGEVTLCRFYDDWSAEEIQADARDCDVWFHMDRANLIVHSFWDNVVMRFPLPTDHRKACSIVNDVVHKYNDMLA